MRALILLACLIEGLGGADAPRRADGPSPTGLSGHHCNDDKAPCFAKEEAFCQKMPRANCAAWLESCPCTCAGVKPAPDPHALQWVGQTPPPGEALNTWLRELSHVAEESGRPSSSRAPSAKVVWRRDGGAHESDEVHAIKLPSEGDMWRVQLGEQAPEGAPEQVVVTDPGAVAGALGLRAGDVVLGINGVGVTGWGLEAVWTEMGEAREKAAGGSVELKLRRAAEFSELDDRGGDPPPTHRFGDLVHAMTFGRAMVLVGYPRLLAVLGLSLLATAVYGAWRYKRAYNVLLADHTLALGELRRLIDENETLRTWLDELRGEEADAHEEAQLAKEQGEAALRQAVSTRLSPPRAEFATIAHEGGGDDEEDAELAALQHVPLFPNMDYDEKHFS
jgi:hypothetical protein